MGFLAGWDDHHIRFDILDSNGEAKSFDIDLNPYLDNFEKKENSYEISVLDESLGLTAMTPDSTVSATTNYDSWSWNFCDRGNMNSKV